MGRFCWRERNEELNWQLLRGIDLTDIIRQGDPSVLEPYALHVTFARLPASLKDSQTRDAWFLVHILQLSMEYLLSIRSKDRKALKILTQKMREVETERDVLLLSSHKWKARVRSSDDQVKKLYHVLQKIATLLQIHGTSPSAVAIIATLLTEMLSARRDKHKRRAKREEDDDGDEVDEMLRQTRHEARACELCGKLFSSAEFLEQHRVRQHSGDHIHAKENTEHKVRRNDDEDSVKMKKNVKPPMSEAAMQKVVQQVEQMLHKHEEKLRSLVEEEAQKIKQIYEHLCADAKLASGCRSVQSKAEVCHEEVKRQLREIYRQEQETEEELAGLTRQIQSHAVKKTMTKDLNSVDLGTVSSYKSDDALVAVEMGISELQHRLDEANAELTVSQEETKKVQALHLSSLRRDEELADTLAVSRDVYIVMQRDQSPQIWLAAVLNKVVQTNYHSSFWQSTSEVLIRSRGLTRNDTGADLMGYGDVCGQTVGFEKPPSFDDEAQIDIIDDSDSALILAASPVVREPLSQESVQGSKSAENAASSICIIREDDKSNSNDMHQVYCQNLLDMIAERSQSAVNKTDSVGSLAPKKYSSICQHKYIRSRFQHDEDLVKNRVADCLLQLEEFARRLGVPEQSKGLSENNMQIAQHALHGHLDILPTAVIRKMVDCEDTVDAIIEKEWIPIEKKMTRDAQEQLKMETRSKSASDKGLVRQVLATRGILKQAELPIGITNSKNQVATYTERCINHEKLCASGERILHDDNVQNSSIASHMDLAVISALRRSTKNQLTVLVGGETIAEGASDDYTKRQFSSPTGNDDFVLASPTFCNKADQFDVAKSRQLGCGR